MKGKPWKNIGIGIVVHMVDRGKPRVTAGEGGSGARGDGVLLCAGDFGLGLTHGDD